MNVFLRLEMLSTNTLLTQLGTTEAVTSIFVNKQLFVRNHSVKYVILSFSCKLQQGIKLRHNDADGGGSTKNDEDIDNSCLIRESGMIKTFTLDNDKLDTGEITFSEEYNHFKFDKNINKPEACTYSNNTYTTIKCVKNKSNPTAMILEIKGTTDTASPASFLDLYLEFDDSGQLSTKIYDKRDDFNFKMIHFRNICNNIPASPAYSVYISQLIRCARASSNYSDFLKRHLYLRNRLLDQGYKKIRLIRSLKKFIFRYQDLDEKYSVCRDDNERRIIIK